MDFFVWQRTVVDEAGNVLPSASVSVTDVVSGALVQLYSDEGVTGIGNPITADANGFVQFYVKAGVYDIVATSGAHTRTWSDEQIGRYETGYVERLGAIGSGSVVDDTAFTDTLAAHAKVMGQPGKTFIFSSGISIPASDGWRTIDLQGSIVEPDDNNGRFTSAALSSTATSTVSSGASIGSRSVVVASATSMDVGHWVRITDAAALFPAFWAKITSIAGTTLEFDRTLPCTYSGTINIDTYSALRGKIRIKNIVFDGTNVTGSPGNDGHAIRLLGFERVEIENIELRNYNQTTGGFIIHIEDCVDVHISRVRAADSHLISALNYLNVSRARSAELVNNVIVAGGFGMNADYCETATFANNILSGRRSMEDDETLGSTGSVRALKSQSTGYVRMVGNDISDYETAVKINNIHRYIVSDNTIRNIALFAYDGSSAISITSDDSPQEPHGIISGNLLENCGANGIAVDDSNGAAGDGNCIVTGNWFIGIGAHAIISENRQLTVTNNRFKNWNTLNRESVAGDNASAAVWHEGGMATGGNVFENTDAADACYINNLIGGQTYAFGTDSILTGNPHLSGGKSLQVSAATVSTIASGGTSITADHTFPYTPDACEFQYQITTATTNDPGPLLINAISATQVTYACRNAPGGGGMNIRWIQVPRMPRTS